ncbi:M20/M25/M40 family metallo-hydrolase [Desulfohalobium retbaense]|uniref:Peptidase M20 n=1 Tax=Desulfohalobium retbaense (strain ATCC 49708 / DSM 5692 / JCM 16813 / HR100) TaxID=485915 RepID=C8WYZ3_DESRD|nr:M20/M25/M40 family metallo-hydrolase [Desulfohalobium retbaense]ACV67909.1 peptidase M20 [Desulfohalobium retbaense DSM 5692]
MNSCSSQNKITEFDIRGWVKTKLEKLPEWTWVTSFLLEMCSIDTSLKEDVSAVRQNEERTFQCIISSFKPYVSHSHGIEKPAIESAVFSDSYYTWPRYSGTEYKNFDYVYNNRYNLLISQKSNLQKKHRWMLHAHIDTVPPHIPPQIDGSKVFGRGAVDDKAGIAAIGLVLRWLHELRELGFKELPPIDAAFTIDEEAGGNGSLALATSLAETPDTILVLEPTRLLPHPANRGALWFQISIDPESRVGDQALVLVAAEIIMEIQWLGKELRHEGVHPLFCPEHVQTCLGIWGDWGDFPASACSFFEFLFAPDNHLNLNKQDITSKLNEILYNEAQKNGLKIHKGVVRVQPENQSHSGWYRVQVQADSGHMGSMTRDTDALTKSAFLISAIKQKQYGDISWIGHSPLTIEGGQGFTPRHSMQEIQNRLKKAVFKAAKRACNALGYSEEDIQVQVGFDKIHNEAFCSDLEALGTHSMLKSADFLLGLEKPLQSQGWQASCDARIYARQCPDVLTFGPGALEHAHSPDEFVQVEDIFKAAGLILLAMLQEGSC